MELRIKLIRLNVKKFDILHALIGESAKKNNKT